MHIFQHLEIERLIRHHALELPVLFFEGAQSLRVTHLQATVLPPPAIERLARNPVATDHFSRLASPLGLLQDRDNLLIGESALTHSSPPRRSRGIGDCQLISGPLNWATRLDLNKRAVVLSTVDPEVSSGLDAELPTSRATSRS
ncbi:MAG TPA: hypothetical protein VFT57_08830 [Gemmatimonadaceae bacterium]|nr:hypothetical protein [Gemmatimonadaceae bacterium]